MLKLSNRNLNQTIMLITHDEKIALEADRIVTMEDGRIISDHFRGAAEWHECPAGHKGIPLEERR